MNASEIYKVGIYLRLSRDDEKDDESQSISNQRDYIMNYIINNNLVLVDEYIDDGISGTQFDRKGWNRLIDDIENGRINMVITKDTSRLGRNISQSLYYSTEYFQEKNVRYIALTEGIDTFDKSQNTDMLMFKAFYNEMYVKDISTKIKATLNSQKRNGKFMGGTAPYGYDRNLPNNKHELIINEEQAIIVKRIYNLFINGMGVKKIANLLTRENIPIPSIQKNLHRGIKSKVYGIWQETTISNILTNPTYKGDLTQGREYKVSYKSKKIRKNAKKDWIIAKRACPAIIDEETFNIVQDMYSKNKNRTNNSLEYLLRGFLVCKECGHTISIAQVKWSCKRVKKIKNICYCNFWKKFSRYNVCTPHKLDYNELETKILKDIREKCNEYLNISNFETLLKNNDKLNKVKLDLEKQLTKIKNDITQTITFIDKLYKDKLKGLIDEEMFKRQYSNFTKETLTFQKKVGELEIKLANIKKKIANKDNIKYTNIIKEFLSLKKPSKKFLSSLIDKIVIDKEQNINICYKIKPLN